MAEVWGAILRGLGAALNSIYDVVPSYVFAIVLLTVAVRVVLIPLTVKQIRSMAAMQKIQPQLKELQKKYKGNRQKMNEEVMKLYREHGVNPLGGCLPLVMQAPVFIALYSVLRAAVPVAALPAEPVRAQIAITKDTFCQAVGQPSIGGPPPREIVCETEGRQQTFVLDHWEDAGGQTRNPDVASAAARCIPVTEESDGRTLVRAFECHTPIGTGHLPKDGDLFQDIVGDRTQFAGMHLACSPTQATSRATIRQCAPQEEGSAGAALVSYYALVALMVGSTWYQQRQMAQRATGPQAKQLQMMGRIMPIFLGFISLSIPAGVIVYWVVSNGWTIGQQAVFFRKGIGPGAVLEPERPAKGEKGAKADKGDGAGKPDKRAKAAKPSKKGKHR